MSEAHSHRLLPCSVEAVDTFLSEPGEGALKTLESIDSDVLVLGAGGKMGLHLCRMLKTGFRQLGKERTVWAASRFKSLSSRDVYEASGVKTFVGDFEDQAFVDSLPECPVIFYLVGAKFGTAGNPDMLKRINIEVSKRIAERFKASKIIAFSTGCVYSYVTTESGGSTETSAMEPIGNYAQSCIGREQAFVDGSSRHGTPVVLIRLNYSVEFRYGVPVDIAKKVLHEEPIDVSMGYVNVIWQRDALDQIIQCLTLVESPPAPINITGPSIIPVRDLAKRFGELFDKEPLITGKEAKTAWLSNASKSHQLFGLPATSLDRMTEWIAAWLTESGQTFNKPTGFDRRDGNY